MVVEQKNEYRPDYVSPPGETLAEILESKNMTQVDLAERTGRTPKLINEIIKGKAPITPETAIQLERVLSIPSSFWNNRQRRFDEFIARKREGQILGAYLDWAMKFPYKDMAKWKWVPETKDALCRLRNILDFFGVANPDAWSEVWGNIAVVYRKSSTLVSDDHALAAWLQKGALLAQTIECEPYNREKFLDVLRQARALTITEPSVFVPEIRRICALSGVAVVFVPELPKTASGATRWLAPHRAILQLSLRYKTDDHLWFTFFHEAAHILFHQKRRIFIESRSYRSHQEDEANRFAADLLVPPTEYSSFVNAHSSRIFSRTSILAFAKKLGIAPGIIAGRLQHEGRLKPSHCNDLKRRLEWVRE